MRVPTRLAVLSLAACLVACSTPVTPEQKAPERRALLWKVEDKDNTVYLLGSFHLLRKEDYPLPANVDAAFADAERVVFELAPAEARSPEVGAKMAAAATLPAGQELRQLLGPDDWARLEAYAASRRMSSVGLARFEPWFVSLVISMAEMQRSGFDPKQGVDQHFMDRAAAANKPTGGLESVDTQVAVLDGMSAEEQRQAVSEALDEAGEPEARVHELHALWLRGDAERIRVLMRDEFAAEYPALYRRINVERNEAWLPQLRAMLVKPGTDDVLVVVGALHLLGSDGLVERLRAQGYKVTRL